MSALDHQVPNIAVAGRCIGESATAHFPRAQSLSSNLLSWALSGFAKDRTRARSHFRSSIASAVHVPSVKLPFRAPPGAPGSATEGWASLSGGRLPKSTSTLRSLRATRLPRRSRSRRPFTSSPVSLCYILSPARMIRRTSPCLRCIEIRMLTRPISKRRISRNTRRQPSRW